MLLPNYHRLQLPTSVSKNSDEDDVTDKINQASSASCAHINLSKNTP